LNTTGKNGPSIRPEGPATPVPEWQKKLVPIYYQENRRESTIFPSFLSDSDTARLKRKHRDSGVVNPGMCFGGYILGDCFVYFIANYGKDHFDGALHVCMHTMGKIGV
jgi:hypothetical protein